MKDTSIEFSTDIPSVNILHTVQHFEPKKSKIYHLQEKIHTERVFLF